MQPRRLAEYQKLDKKLQTSFPNFCYKQKVIEEMMNVASNIHEKILLSQRTIHELERHSHGSHAKAMVKSEQSKIAALESFVRMPVTQFHDAYSRMRNRGSRAPGQDRDGRGEPAFGNLDREEARTVDSRSSTSSRKATWA